MLKLLVSCANGAGTSLMMKMTVENATKALNLAVSEIHHCALSEGVSSATQYDVVFCPLNFVDMYKNATAKGVTVLGLRNVLSQAEVEEKLKASGLVEKHQKK
ncbi:Phosphotransferase system lactose/cellobiose-specific IIB subunit [uncultured Eubacteriales bacterium]|uniref:Phosphotransferase system lactose/cellobiose-specific IIB subunit n=1 Tax=uncultured Eubacteriales bacterium TaxID=172733 RepID=A0A212IYW2_9FIRM|nr:Phosphotransferase system lactose/cellobiose-specific IIB subunit [uncultured Eubacteriales bacterium]